MTGKKQARQKLLQVMREDATVPEIERHTTDYMMKLRFYYKSHELSKTTYFTKLEIEALMWMFYRLQQKYKGRVDCTAFRDIIFNFFSLSDSLMVERVFKCLKDGNSPYFTYENWVRMLNIFLRAPLKERAEYAFNVYKASDYNMLCIRREDVTHYLRNGFAYKSPELDVDEFNQHMVEITMNLFKSKNNKLIEKEEFISAVLEEPCLLDVLGQCLPSVEDIQCMEMLFCEKFHDKTQPFSFIPSEFS